jgi:D-arabinose 1-dehydrogenase-like Zn-dependent alcohol dehydrogenase
MTGGRGVDVVIDFVSTSETMTAGARALGRGGRLVTHGGSSGGTVASLARHLISNEITLMGSRYATKQEVLDSLDLVARSEVWPMVTEVVPMAEAEALHARLEEGAVTARAAIRIG